MTDEQVTVIEDRPAKVITTTKKSPAVMEEPPQKVYNKKKKIFRINQIVWYILGIIETLLAFRVILKILGANPFSGFTSLIYSITDPLTVPFRGILPSPATGNSVLEWATLIAAVVYVVVAWGIVYLLELVNPVTPEEVDAVV